jgi:excisionase family DNA binding protein
MSNSTEYLSVQQTALRLGVSARTVYEMLGDGRIQGALRIGRRVRVPDSALDSLPAYVSPRHAKLAMVDDGR